MRRILLACVLLTMVAPAMAHWSSPGYLEVKQTGTESYSVLWKVPVRGSSPITINPQFPKTCQEKTPVASYHAGNALVQRWSIECAGGLIGKTLTIAGLSGAPNDVLVRLTRLDGTTQTVRLQGTDASFTVTASPSWLEVSNTYLWLGVEHILFGIDHLLFVLALLIIVQGWRRLVATITAFTVAHSVTLAAAVLGFVYVPRQPVEAVIALSILFLAMEIARKQLATGFSSEQEIATDLAYRWPWIVALSFGLLHGFGFAGALTEVGLPEKSIPLALLFFNVGVELGQLVFVAAVVAIGYAIHNIRAFPQRQAQLALAYGIGGIAAYWTIERVAGFWAG